MYNGWSFVGRSLLPGVNQSVHYLSSLLCHRCCAFLGCRAERGVRGRVQRGVALIVGSRGEGDVRELEGRLTVKLGVDLMDKVKGEGWDDG